MMRDKTEFLLSLFSPDQDINSQPRRRTNRVDKGKKKQKPPGDPSPEKNVSNKKCGPNFALFVRSISKSFPKIQPKQKKKTINLKKKRLEQGVETKINRGCALEFGIPISRPCG